MIEFLHFSVTVAKDKWKNLRSVYVRKRKLRRTGSGRKKIKPYYLTNYIKFIIPFIKTQTTVLENVSSPSSAVDIDRVKQEPSSVENTSHTESNVSAATSMPKKRKSEQLSESNNTFLEYVETSKKRSDYSQTSLENPRRQFLESLFPELEEMPESAFRLFKRKVLELIDNLSNAASSASNQPSSSFVSCPSHVKSETTVHYSSNPLSIVSTHISSPESSH